MFQQAVSADIIPNSAVEYFRQKNKEQRHKHLGYTDIGYHTNLEG